MQTLPNPIKSENSARRIPQLDGVRGVAISLVLIWHYVASKIDSPSVFFADYIAPILNLTNSGVDLFLVLSGFLIGGILIDNRTAPRYFAAFYARRICRIFPLYFIWLFIFVILTEGGLTALFALPLQELFVNPLPLWSYATFTQNITMALRGDMGPHWLGVTWSLAVEEQFYLTLPFMIRFLSLRKLPYVLVTVIVAAPLLRVLMFFIPPYSLFPIYVLMPSRMDALLLGVLVAYVVRQDGAVQYLTNHIAWLYGIFVLLGVGMLGVSIIPRASSWFFLYSLGFSQIALLYTCFLLLALVEQRGPIASFTRNRFLRNLGLVAYGVYLFHQAINGLVHGLVLNQSPQFKTELDFFVTLIALSITILLALASWNLFEKKMVTLGHAVHYGKAQALVN